MQKKHFPASERGTKDIGWLQSNFTLSFSDYQDPSLTSFGTLVAFNDDVVTAGKGFGIHPHANMEIISIMLKGTMSHKDSLGYDAEVHEDWIQIMGAGAGLRHEEYNTGSDPVSFLQIWIQPKLQNTAPRYQSRYFPKQERLNKLQTIVSGEEGGKHCWIGQNTKLSLGLYDARSVLNYSFNPVNKCLFVFAITGTIHVGSARLSQRDALGVWSTDTVEIRCEEKAEFLIIETPINQK